MPSFGELRKSGASIASELLTFGRGDGGGGSYFGGTSAVLLVRRQERRRRVSDRKRKTPSRSLVVPLEMPHRDLARPSRARSTCRLCLVPRQYASSPRPRRVRGRLLHSHGRRRHFRLSEPSARAYNHIYGHVISCDHHFYAGKKKRARIFSASLPPNFDSKNAIFF